MKKIFFVFLGVALMAGNAVAQDFEKNIYGVRAGLNVSNVSVQGLSADSKAGFHVAGVYQRLLLNTHPLYLETGLQITQKGFKTEFLVETTKINPLYLEVPVMVNYKFNIKDVVTLYPGVGFYYALGIAGKGKLETAASEEFGTEAQTDKYDLFGSKGVMKRSDFGMRVSATAEWQQFVFSLGYEFGFVNVAKSVEFDSDFEGEDFGGSDWAKMKTGNFFISVGYNF